MSRYDGASHDHVFVIIKIKVIIAPGLDALTTSLG